MYCKYLFIGVIIGASADLIIYPWVALIIGCLGGVVSIVGFEKLTHYLANKINLHDTCGVHNLHGMPGFLGGIIAIIISSSATKENYGDSIDILWPKFNERGSSNQAGYQLAALLLVLGTAIISGLITGAILNLSIFKQYQPYEDCEQWVMEDDEHHGLNIKKNESVSYYGKEVHNNEQIGTKTDYSNVVIPKEIELNDAGKN